MSGCVGRLFLLTKCFAIGIVLLSTGFAVSVIAQVESPENFPSTRIGISAGMGVNYHDAQDIVSRINGSDIVTQRVGDFKSGVDFFGAISVPVSQDWVMKAEYVYLLASYTLNSNVGNGVAEFSYNVNMPTIIGQYILFESSTYNLKAGAGIGFHFGTYSEKYSNVDVSFTGNGIGTLLELEGNTALDENLFAHLGVQMRWDFVGVLRNSAGNPPLGSLQSPSLHFFGIGARLGMTYYL